MGTWLDRYSARLPALVLCAGLALDGLAVWVLQPGNLPRNDLLQHWTSGALFAIGLVCSFVLAGLLQWQISSRRRAEARMAGMLADVERLALVARKTTNAVVITDARGVITWVNTAFEQVTGYSLDESRGHKPGQLLQCDATDRLTQARIRWMLAKGQPFRGDILNRSKAGRVYWINLDIQPLCDAQGRLTGFIGVNSDVTERRQTEEALRVSQAFLHNTGRIAGVGGWQYDPADGRLQWTEQACHLLEMPPGHQPLVSECLALVAPEAREQVEQILSRGVLADGGAWDVELPVVTARGRRLWLQVVAEGEYGDDGLVRLVGAVRDLTARRALEAETRRNAELLRGAVDTVDEGFVLYDPDDRLVFCNDRYRDMYRRSADLLQPGTPFEDIVRGGVMRGQYPEAVGREEAWLAERLAAHRRGNCTLVQRLDDGRVLRLLERRMPDGHVVGFRIDITDLTLATEAAERANRAKSDFIATMSHELRTPLQSVIGFSELGQTFAEGQAPFDAMFDDIHAGGQRMLRLVNALLDVSKLDGNPDALTLCPADLLALAEEVRRELLPLAERRRITLALPQPRPVLIARVDPHRLQQVLRNLLANALRFAPDGSTVQVLGRDLGADGLQIEVRDHGPGIPPDELEAVFDAFVQSSRTRDGSGGTGLGLTISRKIMAAHGGRLSAHHAEGGGACLRLWLPATTAGSGPLAAPDARPPALPAALPEALPHAHPAGRRADTAEALP